MDSKDGHEYSNLPDLIDNLKPHDHLCLIYESREEWLATVVPFISSGLKRGEKCIYVVDANTASQIKAVLIEAGLAVDDYESKGQLSILHERDTYTREGYFDPDLMIALLIEETKIALSEGYPALRATGEMSWALRDYSGVDKVLEYEAKLNRDLFPKYPCVAICQYDRWKFDPEIIKGVVLTHPLLIRGGHIYHNFYYVEPDEYLNHKKSEREVQHWLNNLERERKVQESLRKSEVEYRRLFETMAQGVVYQATDGRIISANPAAERILGLSFDQMHGKTSMDPYWQMIEENGKPVTGEEHPAMIALRTGQTTGPVTRGVYRPDLDKHIWLNITAIPVFQPGKAKPDQAYAVFEDITERKEAAELIEKLAKIADTSPNSIVVHDYEGNILYANESTFKMHGYKKEEFMGLNLKQLDTPESAELIAPRMREIEIKGEAKFEVSHRRKDGENLPLLVDVKKIEWFGKQALLSIATDISERKQAEEDLRKINEYLNFYRMTVDNMRDYRIAVVDKDYCYKIVSKQYYDHYDQRKTAIVGKTVAELMSPSVFDSMIKPKLDQAFQGQTVIFTSWFETPMMGKRIYEVSYYPIFEDDRTVGAVAATIQDITERKKAEDEIIMLNKELEQRVVERTVQLEAVNKELESFAHSISHDFRAPLRALDGFSASLQTKYDEHLDDEGRHYLNRIRNAAIYMSNLVDDLLALSRITRRDFKQQQVDLSKLAAEIFVALQEAEPQREARFKIAPDLQVSGDAALLQAALQNLLENAWKFSSKEAQAEIEVGRTTEEGEQVYFVRDNGVGFNMAYAKNLFGAFQRLHKVGEFPGTGIGLTTVQRIINRHGGRIWAESEVGKGATFYFTLGLGNSGK
jgi:PAS domain S-box-containing protein